MPTAKELVVGRVRESPADRASEDMKAETVAARQAAHGPSRWFQR